MSGGEELAQAAAEALAEDEALRGDLTDDGFLPVLSWATDLAMAHADGWAQRPDPRAAMWDEVALLKERARGVVQSAEAIAPEPLLAVAGPLTDAVADALDQVDWSDDPDKNACNIIAAIASLAWANIEPTTEDAE